MDSSSPAEQLDELPPLSSPSQSRGLFFSSSSPQESDQESPEPLHLVTGEDDAGGSDSGDPWSELPESSDDAPTSSTESSAADRPAALLSKKQMRDTAATAVTIGTGMVHTVAANTEAKQRVGLYLADSDDAVAIGHPLADIMHRRGDVVGGKLSPDANDFLRSLMGVAGYMAKQVQKVGQVRALEAGATAEPQSFGAAS